MKIKIEEHPDNPAFLVVWVEIEDGEKKILSPPVAVPASLPLKMLQPLIREIFTEKGRIRRRLYDPNEKLSVAVIEVEGQEFVTSVTNIDGYKSVTVRKAEGIMKVVAELAKIQ